MAELQMKTSNAPADANAARSRRLAWPAGLALAGLALMLVAPEVLPTYLVNTLIRAFLYAAVAITVDILWGFTGILTFGQSAFFGFGAYAAALVFTHAGFGPGLALAAFGIGLTAGNLIAPRFADKALMPTAAALLLWSAASLALWPLAAHHFWSLCLCVVAIGGGGALGTVLQTRLMDVAGDAQALAAALNHSAFNTANALGPWLGGLAITAGFGWTSTGWVGVALALGGLAVLAISALLERTPRPALA